LTAQTAFRDGEHGIVREFTPCLRRIALCGPAERDALLILFKISPRALRAWRRFSGRIPAQNAAFAFFVAKKFCPAAASCTGNCFPCHSEPGEESLPLLSISIPEIPRPARNDKTKDVSQRHADVTN
jgi:hypothetical protein